MHLLIRKMIKTKSIKTDSNIFFKFFIYVQSHSQRMYVLDAFGNTVTYH